MPAANDLASPNLGLDTSDWKTFNYLDIFEIRKGFYNKKPEMTDQGNIPFLGATDSHNGVTGRYSIEEITAATKTGEEPNSPLSAKLFPPNAVCVTNNGSVGYAYFQPSQFTCSHDVNPLYRKDGEFNVYTGLFVATVIMHDRYRWQYGRKWRPMRMVKSTIDLPATPECLPDWQFMEEFIRQLDHQPITTENSTEKSLPLDPRRFESFTFGALIDGISKAKAHTKDDLTEAPYSEAGEASTIRYVTRTAENNGCEMLVYRNDALEAGIQSGNAISIGDTTATCFYQSEDFVAGDHMVVVRADWMNPFTGNYIATLLNREAFRYSYGRAFVMQSIRSTTLNLPILRHNNGDPVIDPDRRFHKRGFIPDWQFMEDYIRSLPYGDRIPEGV